MIVGIFGLHSPEALKHLLRNPLVTSEDFTVLDEVISPSAIEAIKSHHKKSVVYFAKSPYDVPKDLTDLTNFAILATSDDDHVTVAESGLNSSGSMRYSDLEVLNLYAPIIFENYKPKPIYLQ